MLNPAGLNKSRPTIPINGFDTNFGYNRVFVVIVFSA